MTLKSNLKATLFLSLLIQGYAGGAVHPYANAGFDQTVTDVDGNGSEAITFNASETRQGDALITSYDWRENGSSIATGSSPTVTLPVGIHTLKLIVTDAAGLSHTDLVIINVTSTAYTYKEFVSKKFTIIEQYSPHISGLSKDPDKDGHANVIEYLLVADPKNADSELLKLETQNNQSVFTYKRMANPQGVTWGWEKSTDMKNWQSVVPDTEAVISNQGGEMSMRTAFDHNTEEKLFYRLKVSDASDPALFSIENLVYNGAFRFGPSQGRKEFAVGTLAYNQENHSLFFAGHSSDEAIAEFPIPTPGMQETVAELPVSGAPLQDFVAFLSKNPTLPNPEGLNRITGMLVVDGSLIVNAENWYDAAADNTDTTFVVKDSDNLAGDIDGYFKLGGAAHAAGYMGPIPSTLQSAFGSNYYTGWSNVWSINSRYSIGPSLWTFDPNDVLTNSATTNPNITTQAWQNYPHQDAHINPGMIGLLYAPQHTQGPFRPSQPLWNTNSDGFYGFFVPETDTFMVLGRSSGIATGIGYKAVREDGSTCAGPCTYGLNDNYNFYWLFDVKDILAATNVSDPQPYDYGILSVPFDKGGKHTIIGTTFDPAEKILYVALGGAGQLGRYDRVPLIVTYRIPERAE